MTMQVWTVPAPMRPFVASVWRVDGLPAPHALERLVPTGGMQLLVNLAEDELRWWAGDPLGAARRLRGGAVQGAFAGPVTIDTAQQRQITGVSFTPGGAAAFLPGSMRSFANDHVDFTDVPGLEHLRDRLLEAHDRGPWVLRETWLAILRSRWAPERPCMTAHRQALESGLSVRTAAQTLGQSERGFRRAVCSSVGLSPKAYARVARIQRLVRATSTRGRQDWAALAARFGFVDQSHLIHEFKALVGLTPTAFVPRSLAEPTHGVLHTADFYKTRAHRPDMQLG